MALFRLSPLVKGSGEFYRGAGIRLRSNNRRLMNLVGLWFESPLRHPIKMHWTGAGLRVPGWVFISGANDLLTLLWIDQ